MKMVTCPLCRDRYAPVELLFCVTCRNHTEPAVLDRMRADLQQYVAVIDSRFSDTKKFHERLRLGFHAAEFRPVVGPAVLEVIGQQSEVTDTWEGYQIVVGALNGLGVDEETEIRSSSVTLIPGGNRLTVVRIRAMLESELAGAEGVGR